MEFESIFRIGKLPGVTICSLTRSLALLAYLKLLMPHAYNGSGIQDNEQHISGTKKPGRFCGQVFGVYIECKVQLFSSNSFRRFIEVCIKCREGAKKHNCNNVFNTFDMGVKIRQGVEFLHQTDGYEVLSK